MNVAHFTDVHRAMIQVLMAKGAIKQSELERRYAKLKKTFPDAGVNDGLRELVRDLNPPLNQLSFSIKEELCEVDNALYFVFVTTGAGEEGHDAMVEKCNRFGAKHMEFMHALLHKITQDGEMGRISLRELREIGHSKSMPNRKDVQHFVDELCRGHWLHELRGVHTLGARFDERQYALGVRTIAELGDELKENHCPECPMCKRIIIMPEECPRCGTKYHSACKRRLKRCKNKKCRAQLNAAPKRAREDDETGAGDTTTSSPTTAVAGAGDGAGAGSGSGSGSASGRSSRAATRRRTGRGAH